MTMRQSRKPKKNRYKDEEKYNEAFLNFKTKLKEYKLLKEENDKEW